MRFFFVMKFVIFFFIMGHISLAQDRKIRVFEKKLDLSVDASNYTTAALFLVVFPSKDNLLVFIDQNKAWEVTEVNWQEWQELPESTLIVVQPLVEGSLKTIKRIPEPVRLGSLSLKDLKITANQNPAAFSLTWSMDTLYPAETSVQTSRKIELSNCCDKGTCSVTVFFERKKEHIQLYTSR
ncbi:hypothetical protein [Flavobacterium sp.]|uniref:hypothetical protein n=1 Tax=Flavobacterium sp. TaxID=239 RepID=UPI003D0F3A84